ncbi:MAG: MFS transporter [Spirochaetota bacterium]
MNDSDKQPLQPKSTDGLEDVKQLGMFAAITSLSYVFWVVGGMEMVERLAYYGVKSVATLYANDPSSKGGLGITMSDFGIILTSWAFVQSFIPVFTGGISDRYGYKETIAVSTIIKIIGYLIMGFFPTFTGFFVGSIVLAMGTAVFKPGIQGTLVKSTTRENSSMAWGIFYQTVNIGAFLGPITAGMLRKMAWENVFFACAVIISINFLLLTIYKEKDKQKRLVYNKAVKEGKIQQENLLRDSLQELAKPHVWTYLLLFSGFWFMFNALFDVLPLHIDQWVDSRDIVTTLFGTGGGKNSVLGKFIVLSKDGMSVSPEGLLNVNAGMIMLTCFFFAYVSGKMRATTSMVVGTLMATVAFFLTGLVTAGWASVFAISIFSIGEMLSSPKFSEFIGNFAPTEKKAMYIGFSQIPMGIGWTLEGLIIPNLYERYASKDAFSRELIATRGLMDSAAIQSIPNGEAFDKVVSLTGKTPQAITDILYATHDISVVWNVIGVLGILSALGIYCYGKWILTLKKN